MSENLTKEIILGVINKLPHSADRVPYTYHHDYFRVHSSRHNGMSRSEVASSHESSVIELYAVALTQLLEECGSDAIYCLGKGDLKICKKAKHITDLCIIKNNKLY
jgi:hypothetical protein